MGIYIKGMEIPTSCRACRLKMNCDDCEGLECVCVPLREQIGHLCDLPTDKRRDDCPLVQVPPHGDLIDRDKFRKTMFIGEQCLYSWDEIEDAIDYAPTVIPASEEGE